MACRKCFTAVVLLVFITVSLKGQVEENRRISLAYPVYSQYLHNGLAINPAYAGSRGALSLFTSIRKQWWGIEGAPTLETVSLHTLLKNQRVGLGLTGQFLKYGLTSGQSAFAHYSYQMKLKNGTLAFGIRGGFDRTNTDYSIFRGDPAFASDQAFNGNYEPVMLPNVGTGVYYSNDRFFAGVAVPSILGYSIGSTGKAVMDSYSKFDIIFSGGALFTFSEFFRLKPSILLEYPLDKAKEMRIDINANIIIADFVWLGASWRTSESVLVSILQLQVSQQLMVGYSFDMPMGTLSNYTNGSHEIVFRYEFGYKVASPNPRYF